eukprot:scaffold23672_cov83-Cyclotella_meneghiniana.AAC.1
MTFTSQTLRNKRAAKSARKRLAASTATAPDAAASQNTPSDQPPVKRSSGRPRKKQADGSYRPPPPPPPPRKVGRPPKKAKAGRPCKEISPQPTRSTRHTRSNPIPDTPATAPIINSQSRALRSSKKYITPAIRTRSSQSQSRSKRSPSSKERHYYVALPSTPTRSGPKHNWHSHKKNLERRIKFHLNGTKIYKRLWHASLAEASIKRSPPIMPPYDTRSDKSLYAYLDIGDPKPSPLQQLVHDFICEQEMMGGKQFFLLENRRVKFKIRRNDDLNREKFLRYFKYFSALFSLGQS